MGRVIISHKYLMTAKEGIYFWEKLSVFGVSGKWVKLEKFQYCFVR